MKKKQYDLSFDQRTTSLGTILNPRLKSRVHFFFTD